MKKFTFSFNGRQTGAIGIKYNITHSYEAENISEAKTMLWTDYEWINMYSVNGATIEQYENAPFSNTKYQKSIKRY